MRQGFHLNSTGMECNMKIAWPVIMQVALKEEIKAYLQSQGHAVLILVPTVKMPVTSVRIVSTFDTRFICIVQTEVTETDATEN